MLKFETPATAKAAARTLGAQLANRGLSLPHGECLNMVAAMAGVADWNALSAQLSRECAAQGQLPLIQDVPFHEVSAAIVCGRHMRLDWREEAVLALLEQAQEGALSEDAENALSSTALAFRDEEGGLVWEENLTLEALLSLRWNPRTRQFENNELRIQFLCESPAR